MKSVFCLSIAALILVPGCGGKKEKSASTDLPAVEQARVEVKKKEFVPTSDSSITLEQMKSWLACNPLLDSLAFIFSDSFKTEDPKARIQYQQDFMIAQDKICLRAGLPGGYKEYRWIMENVGNAKNAEILRSMNASTF